MSMLSDFLSQYGEYHNDLYFKDLTTIRMGGHIAHFIYPNTIDDVQHIVRYLRSEHIDFKVIGNGSNLVCGESEYEGVVICLKKIDGYEINGEQVYAEAGVKAPLLANVLAKNGLSGFEFAGSIPGDVGGLLYMNAGAYKSDMSAVVDEVLVLKKDELVWMKKDELEYAYRSSIFQRHPHWVVLACRMSLVKKDSDEIFDLMNDRLERRKASQPLDKASCGSCFRNPEADFAWKYIDEMGYRGYKLNGIEVSEKHSNFIVNNGGGTAADFLKVVYEIQEKAKEKYGIKLIMEVEKFNC